MKNKAFAVIVCLVLVAAMAIPGTLALSTDTDSSQTNATAEVPATPETPSETPAETLAPSEQPTEGTSEQPKQSTEEETPAPSETPKECTCDPKPAEGEAHKEGCPLYVAPEQPAEAEKTCTCDPQPAEGETHKEGCPLYVAPEQPAEAEKTCTCDPQPAEGEAHLEGCPLYVKPTEENPFKELYYKLMATASIVEFKEICAAYTDDDIAQFEKWVVENGLLDSLQSHIYAISPAPTMPETVVFTDAGPFMPPVTVERVRRRAAAWAAAADDSADTGNGLELKKEATANGDGTYTIRLEAYTTGTVTTTTRTVPVDIVLVLDQSGSMADDFNGNSTNTNQNRRQYAMKQAVNSFIGAVNEKYEAGDADHRMAIVTFGSNAETLQGWTYVDTTGEDTLQGIINGLPDNPSGATNAGAGMQQAETLMSSGYNYTGNNTKRQKVVVFFTDGVPTTNTDFDTTVATAAISSAKNLKDGGATVYTVGIFNGAKPEQLHGDKFDRWLVDDDPCNGNVGEYWGYTNLNDWFVGGEETIRGLDIAATNRFLNFLSSNFKDANEIGIEEYSSGLVGGVAWRITKNFNRTASNYYLTAKDYDSLNTIFQTISVNIQSANIDLGSQTVVKDTVSKYFDLPANTSDVKLYTAAAKADGTFESAVPANGVNASFEGNAVSVTGFDFNANFVSKELKSDNTYGKKLIIEFNVTPKPEFIGGNDVPTNDWQNTAVYDKDKTEVEKFADEATTPTVNVTIDDVTVTAADKNVYLLGGLTAAQLKEGATVTVGEGTKAVSLDLSKANENYGLEAWQTAYVNITVKLYGADGTTEITDLSNLTADTTYTISVTVAPKTTGSTTAKTGTSTPAAKINLFKPELTFRDSSAYYGETVPANNNYSGNVGSETWKHGDTVSTNVTMLGTKPTLDITYTPDASKLKDGKYTKQDVPVAATVKIGTENVNEHTTFVHQDCTTACGWKNPATPGTPAFLIHIQTCTLEIKKTGGADDESYVFDVLKDGEKYSEVTVWGNGTETLVELPIGTYTISENAGWSWRYTANNGSSAELTAQNPTGSITCVNTKNNNQWLNGFSEVVRNIFDTNH